MIDIPGSVQTLRDNEHVHGDGQPWKLTEDLERYERVIEATRPELIIETGTRDGSSARWFSLVGQCRVLTIDVAENDLPPAGSRLDHHRVVKIRGDSISPRVYGRVSELARGRRVMVSLDSNHSTAHVRNEIMLYGPLVSVDCYLVVEDGIFHYADADLRAAHALADMVGDPLSAIMSSPLPHSNRWHRDLAIEDMYQVTHHPAGWWRRQPR